MLKWLLKRDISSLEETNVDGLDPLLSACNGGHREMVELLIRLGCNLHYVNSSGYSPLILAACGGHLNLVKWLHQQGCSLNDRTREGDSALLLACYCGHTDLVQWFLKQGLDLSERNNAGLTPLISAANGGHPGVVDLLIEAGASIDEIDNEGYSSFLLAARRGFLKTAQTLAVRGANIDARTKTGLDAIALAFEHEDTREWIRSVRTYQPLHIACALGSVKHVKKLLYEGANPLALTKLNSEPTPFDLAKRGPASVLEIMYQATRRWTPQTHRLFGPNYRKHAVIAMMVANKLLEEDTGLPTLPYEIWLHIIAMMSRNVEKQSPSFKRRRSSRRRTELVIRATQTELV